MNSATSSWANPRVTAAAGSTSVLATARLGAPASGLLQRQSTMKQPQPLDEKTAAQCELPVEIKINTMQALALLGTCQLALRHPGFAKRPTSKWIDAFARDLQKLITTNAPGLAFLCDAGWNKRFDA